MKPKTTGVIQLTNDNVEAILPNIQTFHSDVITINRDGVTSKIDVYPTEKAAKEQFKDRRNSESIKSVETNGNIFIWKDMGYGKCSKSCAAGLISFLFLFLKIHKTSLISLKKNHSKLKNNKRKTQNL